MCFYNSNYCNNCGQNNYTNNKNSCCEEQLSNFSYCGKTSENSFFYYPTNWQCENATEQQNNVYERSNCTCNLKHFCYGEQGQNTQQNCESNNYFGHNCLKQKQCNKLKNRCCFCNFFNCICGRR